MSSRKDRIPNTRGGRGRRLPSDSDLDPHWFVEQPRLDPEQQATNATGAALARDVINRAIDPETISPPSTSPPDELSGGWSPLDVLKTMPDHDPDDDWRARQMKDS